MVAEHSVSREDSFKKELDISEERMLT